LRDTRSAAAAMIEPVDSPENIWWRDKSQKGRSLAEEIKALATQARAAGFDAAAYILDLAAAELWKDIEKEDKTAKK
jgi:hypothetical protein